LGKPAKLDMNTYHPTLSNIVLIAVSNILTWLLGKSVKNALNMLPVRAQQFNLKRDTGGAVIIQQQFILVFRAFRVVLEI